MARCSSSICDKDSVQFRKSKMVDTFKQRDETCRSSDSRLSKMCGDLEPTLVQICDCFANVAPNFFWNHFACWMDQFILGMGTHPMISVQLYCAKNEGRKNVQYEYDPQNHINVARLEHAENLKDDRPD